MNENKPIDFEKLAKEQFFKLQEDTLNEDRHSLGAENTENYIYDCFQFKIKVDGFWESSTWFDWTVYSEIDGKEILSGSYCN